MDEHNFFDASQAGTAGFAQAVLLYLQPNGRRVPRPGWRNPPYPSSTATVRSSGVFPLPHNERRGERGTQ
jgi:hypothetical protein